MVCEKDLEKKVIALYKIDPEKVKKILLDNKINDKTFKNQTNLSSWEILNEWLNKKAEIQILKKKFLKKFDRKCYLYRQNNNISWKAFANTFLKNKIKNGKIENISLILLIKEKNNDEIFVICFGAIGNQILKKFFDDDFGFDIVSSFVDFNKNNVKSKKSQNLAGSIIGQIDLYRQLHSITDMDDFGKIFQELDISLECNELKKFGIDIDKQKLCSAKSSFKIRTGICSNDIEKYIEGCIEALKNPKQSINKIKKIYDKSEKEKILSAAISKITDDILSGKVYELNHKDFEKYTQADIYKCTYNRKTSEFEYGDSLNCLLKKFNVEIDNKSIKNFIFKGTIKSYETNSTIPSTNDHIEKYIHIECIFQNKNYFIINGDVYQIEENFFDFINQKIKQYKNSDIFVDNTTVPFNMESWNTNIKDEEEYNNLYKNKQGYIVFHPRKLENIELCDFIKYDEKNLYLYFVKDGFDNNIRALSSQIKTCTKLVKDFNLSNSSFIEDYYNKFMKQEKDTNAKKLSTDQFIQLFKEKKIKYIFAYKDKSNNSRNLENNPEQFNSNIAKMELLSLITYMNSYSINSLKIVQIPK